MPLTWMLVLPSTVTRIESFTSSQVLKRVKASMFVIGVNWLMLTTWNEAPVVWGKATDANGVCGS